jgi:hypothetical protein
MPWIETIIFFLEGRLPPAKDFLRQQSQEHADKKPHVDIH